MKIFLQEVTPHSIPPQLLRSLCLYLLGAASPLRWQHYRLQHALSSFLFLILVPNTHYSPLYSPAEPLLSCEETEALGAAKCLFYEVPIILRASPLFQLRRLAQAYI